MNPTEIHERRMAGLEHANRVRSYRAEVKRNLRAGADPVPIILDPPPELRSMGVYVFLRAIPRFGRVKAHNAMRSLVVGPRATLGSLTDRQRAVIAEELR